MPLPSGPIRAKTPFPNSPRFGIPWENVTRHQKSFERAHAKYPRVSIALGSSMTAIESGGVVDAINCGDGTGICSEGLMQVKTHYWQDLEPNADVWTPDGGILLGFAVMDQFIRQLGTWQAAIGKYHPGRDPKSGASPETYVASVGDLMAEYNAAVGDQPESGTYNWTVPAWPKGFEKRIVQKPGEGAGFDRVAFRGPRMVGVCNHITDGYDTKDSIYRLFSTGGERQWDALTDCVVDRDGTGYLLNDPWTESDGGTRSGWASGGSNGLEGDGIEFVRVLGSSAINGRLFSKEHNAKEGQALTDKQVELSIAVSVVAHQRAHTKWDQFPYNDIAGCVTDMEHREFATKSCPAEPFISNHAPVIRQGVKQGLKLIQTGLTGPVDPIPETPKPDPMELPFDLSWDAVAFMFGTLRRVMPDGTVRNYPADPKGIVTNTWLARAAKDGVFPRAVEWQTYGDKHFILFQNGWVLYAPAINNSVNFRWVDITDLEAEQKAA